jgi:hypothetical protein
MWTCIAKRCATRFSKSIEAINILQSCQNSSVGKGKNQGGTEYSIVDETS